MEQTPLDYENKNSSYAGKLIAGMLVSNVIGLALIGISKYIMSRNPGTEGVLTGSNFVLTPLLMGFICGWFWRHPGLRAWRTIPWTVLNTFIAIGLSFIFLGEGVFCLVIVSPLILGFMIAGVFIGKAILNRKNTKLSASILGLIALFFIHDNLISGHNFEKEVSDTLVINASPEKIWPHVVAYDPIETEPDFWMFKMGMPKPMQTTVDCYGQGCGRKCIFNDSIIFDEKMTVFQPGKDLTFEVTRQPRDPEILGHIDITKGQFILIDNGNGTTTLVGNSWYKLYVFPVWYYDLWAESITRNVHIRVMKQVKKLSEG